MFSTLSHQAASRRAAVGAAVPPAATAHANAEVVAMRHVAATVCPISRRPIRADGGAEDRACVVALNDARGWQPGNLAVLGAPAMRAKTAVGLHEALAHAAAQIDAACGRRDDSGRAALDATQWRRLGVLLSFVMPLPHAVAAALPLAVLPPPGVQPANPIQALQWLLTRELARTDGCARVRLLGQGFGDTPLARDYYRFAAALLPRLIEARRLDDALLARQACEDAWLQPLVHRLWQRLALQLDARRTRTLLRHALRHGIGGIGEGPAPATRLAGQRPRRALKSTSATPPGGDSARRLPRPAKPRNAAVAAAAGRPGAAARRQANTATT